MRDREKERERETHEYPHDNSVCRESAIFVRVSRFARLIANVTILYVTVEFSFPICDARVNILR